MPRYKLLIEYFGPAFSGWQRDPSRPGVQAALSEAIFRFCGEQVQVTGAGRTDAGVHARGQVGHCDLSKQHEPFTVMNALNAHLRDAKDPDKRDVSILAAERVPDDFHARFSALARHYTYRILNRRPPPVLDAPYVWHVPEPLDVPAMHAAAQVLVGHHDFTSFRDTQCQAKSPVKTLEKLEVTQSGGEIHINASARSFLHHQVRIMTGSLQWVGTGRWTAQHMAKALAARDRTKGGPTAPAQGLCLMRVDY